MNVGGLAKIGGGRNDGAQSYRVLDKEKPDCRTY